MSCLRRFWVGVLLSSIVLVAAEPTSAQSISSTLPADTLRRSLTEDLVDHWYPRAIDSLHGGYLSDFSHDWAPTSPQNKFIVTQARHVWATAELHQAIPRPDSLYLRTAHHGVRFLRETMWDDTHGGFFSLVNRQGDVQSGSGSFTDTKTAYGTAFAVYGLANFFSATGDSSALRLAQEAFRWLDENAHDDTYGGYFRNLRVDGRPYREGYDANTPPKNQNSTIHLLEAFTTLYEVAPQTAGLRERLRELLVITRDTMTTDRGSLQLFFERDWTPVSYRDSAMAVREAHYNLDHVSFGHDVETAFLMLDAAEALGMDPVPTLTVGKRMVDHALRHGWDGEDGGLYDGGLVVGTDSVQIVRSSKSWWGQVEALHTFLLMEEHFPEDAQQYGETARMQWRYINRYLIDHTHGGWYVSGVDETPDARTAPKGNIWKGIYHNVRGLLESIELLRHE